MNELKHTVINTLKTKSILSSALGELLCTKVPLLVISCQVELPTRITVQFTTHSQKHQDMKTDILFVSPIWTKQNPVCWNWHHELGELGDSSKPP